MKCPNCHEEIQMGLSQCPHCHITIHYNGKSIFYERAIKSSLTIQDFFNDTFKKHPIGAIEKFLMAGTSLTTPSPEKMLLQWDKPWVYARVFGIGLILVAMSFVTIMVGMRAGESMLLTVPVSIMPLAVLTFFFEMNIPRDISIYKVILIFIIGGFLAIILLPFFGHGNITYDSAQYAAFTEEPAKMLVTATVIYLLNPRYIFGGLLIGAAVGAGFGAFESFDYVIHDENPLRQMIYRSVTILGTHLMWAAIEGGALVMVKGNDKLKTSHFTDLHFLKYFSASIAFHFISNSHFGLMQVPFFIDAKYILTSVAAVFIVSTLINKAILQIFAETTVEKSKRKAQEIFLVSTSGALAGCVFSLKNRITIGRDPNSCNIIFPPKTPFVSRQHCSLEKRMDGVYIIDLNSSAGVFFKNGKRIPNNQWTKVTGDFYLGSPAITFSIKYKM